MKVEKTKHLGKTLQTKFVITTIIINSERMRRINTMRRQTMQDWRRDKK